VQLTTSPAALSTGVHVKKSPVLPHPGSAPVKPLDVQARLRFANVTVPQLGTFTGYEL
jgi:hypothetical protein